MSDTTVLGMLSFQGVHDALPTELQALWQASIACYDTPSDQSWETFRKLCRPGDVMLLLRVAAENSRLDRKHPLSVNSKIATMERAP